MENRMAFVAGAENLPMVDVYLPMMKSAALIAAGQLGVFQALAAAPLDAAALAAATSSSEAGITRLAEFLVTLGYLQRDGSRFANSAHATRWFTQVGDVDYSAGLHWTGLVWELMGGLTECVRQGGPSSTLWELMQQRPAWGPTFSRYMQAFAEHLGPDLLTHVALPPTAKRLLDLGGSHGQHTLAFCRAHPGLEAVIVDQASALTDTAQTLQQAGLSERVRLCPGDLREVAWGCDYDLVLFLSVMHNQTAADNQRSVERIAQALRPGGLLVIHEYAADSPSAAAAAFQLTLLTETGTSTHAPEAIGAWLAAAGLSEARRIDLSPRDKGSLFVARKS